MTQSGRDRSIAPWSNSVAVAVALDYTRNLVGMGVTVNVEVIMPTQSSMHFYLNWAKERIDEMDAMLASLEAKANQVQADSRAKANQFIGDLQNKRDEFQAIIEKQTDASEADWLRAKGQLENTWNGFEMEVKKYLETFGKQLQHQRATFKDAAAAQLKAWQDAVQSFNSAAAKLATDRRAEIDSALKRMKADASEAEANLQKLKSAGTESWAGLNGALTESRAAFDRANQSAWDAFKRAANPGT